MNSPKKFIVFRVDDYNITEQALGKGNFGYVLAGSHIPTNLEVAVKVIDLQSLTPYVKKHVNRESFILSKLSHPCVVTLFQVIQTPTKYYIFMERCGETLSNYISRQPKQHLSEKHTKKLAKQIVSGIAHLHSNGVIHRDIKCENLLIKDGRVKIIDFGLAKICDPATANRTSCGSPEYAAPEIHLGITYGPNVDVWGLGIVMYAMLFGKLPYRAKNMTGDERSKHLLNQKKEGLSGPKQRKYLLRISSVLQNLMKKLLEPNPKKRFSIDDVEHHAWIFDNFDIQYQKIDLDWKVQKFAAYSDLLQTSVEKVVKEIQDHPYGHLGGSFNVDKFIYQNEKFELFQRDTPDVNSIL